jgi:Holliday junction DNA helicase RuvB
VRGEDVIEPPLAKAALDMLGVDAHGLDDQDRKLLSAITELFGGGPVGLSTLAAALNEDTGTIEDIYEPYLIQRGLLERTPRGRKATRNTYKYLGIRSPSSQRQLNVISDDMDEG